MRYLFSADYDLETFSSQAVFTTPTGADVQAHRWATIVDLLSEKLLNSNKEIVNTIYSPWSVAALSTSLRLATAGKSAQEFDTLLGLRQFPHWEEGFAALVAALSHYDGPAIANNATHPPKQSIFHQALGAFIAKDIAVKKDFLVNTRQVLNTEEYRVNFGDSISSKAISAWVKRQTAGLITSDEHYSANTRFVLMSTAYFAAQWETPFDACGTLPFYVKPNSSVNTDFMSKVGFYQVAHTPQYQVVRLNYLPHDGSEPDIVMDIFLPAVDLGVKHVLDARIRARGSHLVEKAHKEIAQICLPRWMMKTHLDLLTWYKTVGVDDITTAHADFSPMTSESLVVDKATHDAFIEVKEQGTVAAALSKAHIMRTSAPLATQNKIVINRPFAYHILDAKFSLPLFSGIVVDPTKTDN